MEQSHSKSDFKTEISVTLEPTKNPTDKMTLLLKSLFSFGHKYSLNVFRITLPNFFSETFSGWTPSEGKF
jgi:hypothetical protein